MYVSEIRSVGNTRICGIFARVLRHAKSHECILRICFTSVKFISKIYQNLTIPLQKTCKNLFTFMKIEFDQ